MHMRLLSATVSRDRYQEADQPATQEKVAPALRYFKATTFDEAIPVARAVYAGARDCVRCRRVLARRYDCLGSTLFRDDDPYELARSFDVADGDVCTVRMLAACIVLFARDRESVH